MLLRDILVNTRHNTRIRFISFDLCCGLFQLISVCFVSPYMSVSVGGLHCEDYVKLLVNKPQYLRFCFFKHGLRPHKCKVDLVLAVGAPDPKPTCPRKKPNQVKKTTKIEKSFFMCFLGV